MRVLEAVDTSVIHAHLAAKNSGVKPDRKLMPGIFDQLQGFRGQLEETDKDRLILWWEFQDSTEGKTCRLGSLVPQARELPRVRSFMEGNATKGLSQVNMADAVGLELVVVADQLPGNWLYIIDGNHRAISQHFQGLSFQDVAFLALVHPRMHWWMYIPEYYKTRWTHQ